MLAARDQFVFRLPPRTSTQWRCRYVLSLRNIVSCQGRALYALVGVSQSYLTSGRYAVSHVDSLWDLHTRDYLPSSAPSQCQGGLLLLALIDSGRLRLEWLSNVQVYGEATRSQLSTGASHIQIREHSLPPRIPARPICVLPRIDATTACALLEHGLPDIPEGTKFQLTGRGYENAGINTNGMRTTVYTIVQASFTSLHPVSALSHHHHRSQHEHIPTQHAAHHAHRHHDPPRPSLHHLLRLSPSRFSQRTRQTQCLPPL